MSTPPLSAQKHYFQQLCVITSQEHVDALEAAFECLQLYGFDCCSLTITSALEDNMGNAILEPELGATPLWQRCQATALFHVPVDQPGIVTALKKHFSEPIDDIAWQDVPDKHWEREWLQHFKPLCFANRLWVGPQIDDPAYQQSDDLPVLWLDPGLAFGTGNHETTRLCLQWLATQNWQNQHIVDYGCGSGILALAAIIMGAKFAHCIDIDPQALMATSENAQRNNISDVQFDTALDSLSLNPRKADVVFANILAEPLKSLVLTLAELLKPNGQICLSGILQEQADSIVQCYELYFDHLCVDNDNGWVRIVGTRNKKPI